MALSIFHMLISFLIFVLMQKPTVAIEQSYIVYLGSHSFGPNPSSIEIESVTNSHYDLLGSYVGSVENAKEAIFYSYNKYINGFVAILDEDEAANIAKHPNVVSVFLNRKLNLLTTRSWDFLGLERDGEFPNDSLWKKTLGEDVIIANLDTGVWPESKSFSDEGYGPVPKRWRGTCQVTKGNAEKFHCNRKLIGARYFFQGHEAATLGLTEQNETIVGARDMEGHGSHTLSTAGGNFVANASVFGLGNGKASGGSPKARVATYKVCWSEGCYESDLLAGFEAAISDGVDVISMSVGGRPTEFNENSISIGSFHAVANGIIVVAGAGNSGPTPYSATNVEPWMLTVGASTIDRSFSSYAILGNKKIFKGPSLSELNLPSHKLYPLISAADAKFDNVSAFDARDCREGTLDPHKAKGKILVCLRGGRLSQTDTGVQALKAGAVGMILANMEVYGDEVFAEAHVLPAIHVTFEDGNHIFDYVNNTKFPKASITKVKTQLGIKPTPTMAEFSSRGPNTLEPAILKPDITAPGVDIVAAFTQGISPSEVESDKRRIPYMLKSGTSMSCPHVSGLVGLLKSLHPDWSPAAIKSAIMTSATIKDNTGNILLNSSRERATPFAYGAGHIRPNHAADPGLVYDLSITDHMNFLCGRNYTNAQIKLIYGKPYTCPKSPFNVLDFNYPAITIPKFKNGHSLTVTRTVTNVGNPSNYEVRIETPPDFEVSVKPNRLRFEHKGEKKQFKVTFTLKSVSKNTTEYSFGRLIWSDGNHLVGIPLSIRDLI